MVFATAVIDTMPLELVVAWPFAGEKVALGPPGSAKVTVTPLSGLPYASVTLACNCAANACPAAAL